VSAINDNASINYDGSSGFDNVGKKLLKSNSYWQPSSLWKVKQSLQRTTLGALVCGGLGVSPEDLFLNLALQSSPQVQTVPTLGVHVIKCIA